MQINCDWQITCKSQEVEKELENFNFDGPGWYLTETHTILIIPTCRETSKIWHKKFEKDEEFHILCWNTSSQNLIFRYLAQCPVRLDERE